MRVNIRWRPGDRAGRTPDTTKIMRPFSLGRPLKLTRWRKAGAVSLVRWSIGVFSVMGELESRQDVRLQILNSEFQILS
jgi:hypothetical protein